MPLHACTVVNPGGLARARVLAQSFREHHPHSSLRVLIVQEPGDPVLDVPGADVLGLDDLGIPAHRLRTMILGYSTAELFAAVKPWLLARLLDGGAPHALFVDPSVWFTGRVHELLDLVAENSVVLTPAAGRLPRDGHTPTDQDLLLAGVYDPGFLAVADNAEGRRLLAWWCERSDTDCVDDPAHGYFLDRRWLDMIPALFEHLVVRDPSWNVGYATLPSRQLSRTDGQVLIDGRPITFWHFDGYNPLVPHLLSDRQGDDPRVLLSADHVLREVCGAYRERLLAAGHVDAQTDHSTPYAVVDGVELDGRIKALVRVEARAQARGRGTGLDLYGSGGVGLAEWLAAPSVVAGAPSNLGRYLYDFYVSRPDLHGVYPEVRRGQPRGFLDWAELVGIDSDGIPRWLVEEAKVLDPSRAVPAAEADDTLDPHGVEVIGFLSADLGIGQAARMLVAGLEEAGIPVSTTTYTRTSSRLGTPWADRPTPPGKRYDVAVVCLNADMLPTFVSEDQGAEHLRDRYVIGFWFWELDDFPDTMMPALEPLDEVWVTSDFTADVLRARTDKPVRTLALPVHAPDRSDVRIHEIQDRDVFTFLFVFDHLSVMERKNPHGLIEAFGAAFPEPGQARLVIKSINGDRSPLARERLRYAASGRTDVVLVERYLSREELDGLMWASDCYVSLHRSEGFGFTMAEMMAIGKPVIGTGYSGNMTFMTEDNSRLVRYRLVPVPPGCDPYPESSRWAAPRIPHAAKLMRRLYEDADLRDGLGAQAARTIATRHSDQALAEFAVARLAEIRAERARGASWRSVLGKVAGRRS